MRFTLPAGVEAADLAALLDGDATVSTAGRPKSSSRRRAPTATLHALTGWALDRGHELDGLVVQRPSLEDLFLTLAATTER